MDYISIINPGLFTTIQDGGRFGYRKFGIPVAGAMDQWAAGLANALLNKPIDAAVIEVIIKGPKIKFDCDTFLAISGANLSPSLDGKEVKNNSKIQASRGQILSFGAVQYGAIAYIAFSREIKTETILGSKSYSKSITSPDRFYAGQQIILEKEENNIPILSSSVKPFLEHFNIQDIIAFEGPEFNLLNIEAKKKLLQESFVISREYSRMGYKLEGPQIKIKYAGTMISSAVIPGTVQLTPAGQLIILMNDCQTTGGYPRILQLSQSAINYIAQKKAGDKIFFRL
ncbi:MAG: biotin-dependent carboxyltransferase family protein [Bacteroidota bacterium]|nr:biotin-dependent carboxyltransferase family protein [Bacteroidota bacterium]